MSNYTKSTSFTSKDALLTGDPNKKIRGSDVDTELDAIGSMSATKANKIASPTNNNVIKQDANGDLVDSGYSFPNLVGACLLTLTEINKLDGYTGNTNDLNAIAGIAALTITPAKIGYLSDVTSNIQAQFTATLAAAAALVDDLSGVTDVPAARDNLGFPAYKLYGDGLDGDITYSSTQNIASGLYFCDNFTVNSGVTLGVTESTNGYLIVIAKTAITINGTINLTGKGSAGGAGGVPSNPGTTGDAGYFGGSGGGGGKHPSGAVGGDGGAARNIAGGVDGAPGAAGNTFATGSGNRSLIKSQLDYQNWILSSLLKGGAGGGGGGGETNSGQAGGNGGGVVILIAPTITIGGSASITASGNAGTASSTSGGAGGGGGGGVIILLCPATTMGGTLTASGGAGGNASAGTWDGGAGGAGFTFYE